MARKIEQPDQLPKVRKALHREMVHIASPYAEESSTAPELPATPWRERVERAADNITSAFAMIGRDNVAADILAETALRGGFPEHAPTEKE